MSSFTSIHLSEGLAEDQIGDLHTNHMMSLTFLYAHLKSGKLKAETLRLAMNAMKAKYPASFLRDGVRMRRGSNF